MQIADVCKWMTENVLKLNEEKTDFIIFAAHTNQDTTPSLCIGESVINPSESIKMLGVTLDNRLTMQKHITNTRQSSYMHIRKINSIRRYLSEQATLTLINSTVLIQLDYCNSVYVGLPQTSLHKLQQQEWRVVHPGITTLCLYCNSTTGFQLHKDVN